MVRLSKVARRRLVSTKRPKIKTSTQVKSSAGSAKSENKKVSAKKAEAKKIDIRIHKNALSGDIANTMFVPHFNY